MDALKRRVQIGEYKTRGRHKKCPKCGSMMKRMYSKFQEHKFRKMRAVGWFCLNPECRYVEMDFWT